MKESEENLSNFGMIPKDFVCYILASEFDTEFQNHNFRMNENDDDDDEVSEEKILFFNDEDEEEDVILYENDKIPIVV